MDLNKNYYDILDIQHFAEIKEVRKSYRRLALIYHPDRVAAPHKKKAEEKFKEIVEAHYVLADPKKKKTYDQYLQARTPGPCPDFTQSTRKGKRQSYTEAEIQEILRRYFGENGYRTFKDRQTKDFSNKGRFYRRAPLIKQVWGMSAEGQLAAVVFCLFFYTMTFFNRDIKIPIALEIVIPAGLMYILLESRLKKIKEPAIESGPIWMIWLCYFIALVMTLSQAFQTV